jgi:sigma-B regulation protein RsbU (phosphoserine phosphatase)
VNGGHNPPAVVGAAGIRERLMPTGPAVGMLPRFAYGVRETRLAPGEMLFAFTDGATDARSPQGEFFTEKRLLDAVADPRLASSAETLATRLQESLIAHISTAAQYDDITMLVVRRAVAS